MAEMETAVNTEFLKLLEKNRTVLNSAFEYYSSGESRIDQEDIYGAFLRIVNPLYNSGLTLTDKTVISVFRCLLKLISKRLLGSNCRYKDLENYFYSIIEKHGRLVSEHGEVFLLNVYNAILNLSEKKIPSIGRWVSSITDLPADTGIENFRTAGFILAWMCGAASARENSSGMIDSIRPEILKHLFAVETADTAGRERLAETIKENPWQNPVSMPLSSDRDLPVFRTAGGFTGYGGEFCTPPVAAFIENGFFATDGYEVFRLYADYFGTELVREPLVTPADIQSCISVNKIISDGKICISSKKYSLPAGWKTGVSSSAASGHTAVWTLYDSYKLYIAGKASLK